MDAAEKKKPGLAILLGVGDKPKAGEDEEEPASEAADEGQAQSDAMEEFISAVQAKDTGKAVEAFKVLKSLCHDDDEEE